MKQVLNKCTLKAPSMMCLSSSNNPPAGMCTSSTFICHTFVYSMMKIKTKMISQIKPFFLNKLLLGQNIYIIFNIISLSMTNNMPDDAF